MADVITQSRLDAIVKAYTSGVTKVTYDGRSTEYRTLSEMETIIAAMAAFLGVDNPISGNVKNPPRYTFARFSRS